MEADARFQAAFVKFGKVLREQRTGFSSNLLRPNLICKARSGPQGLHLPDTSVRVMEMAATGDVERSKNRRCDLATLISASSGAAEEVAEKPDRRDR